MAIVVPFNDDAPPRPDVDESYALMAAANMHKMGRLIEPETSTAGQLEGRTHDPSDPRLTVAEPNVRSRVMAMANPVPKNIQDDIGQMTERPHVAAERKREDPSQPTPREQIEERFPAKEYDRLGPPVTRYKPDRSKRPIIPGEWMPDPQGRRRTVRQI